MFIHPDLMATIAKERNNGLIEEASRHRLAAALRRSQRRAWPDSRKANSAGSAGRLATCEVDLAGQAR